jgi:hypothetical protein
MISKRNFFCAGIIIFLLMVSWLVTTAAFAQGFQLSDPQTGALTYDGQTIIAKAGFALSSDQIIWNKNTIIEPGSSQLLNAPTQNIFAPASADWKGAIAYGQTTENFPWTREVATQETKAEVSTAILVPPAIRDSNTLFGQIKYYFPVDLLKGSHYLVRYGSRGGYYPESQLLQSGTLTGNEPDDTVIKAGIRQFQFTGGKCDLTIDLSPTGPWGVFEQDPSGIYLGNLGREGNYYVLVIPLFGARWGAKFADKIVLYAGAPDLKELHPIDNIHYQWRMPTTRRIQFTPGNPVTGFSYGNTPGYADFTAWQTGAYAENQGVGWEGSVNGTLKKPDAGATLGPLFSGGVAGRDAASFRLKQPNALVLVNVLLSGAQGTSQVRLRCNGGAWNAVTIPNGERRIVTILEYVKSGTVTIDIDGKNWLWSGIIIQPLFFQNEDYLYSRCWWAFGKAPWEWAAFSQKDQWKLWPDGGFGPLALPMSVAIGQ